jgi:uncharacterized protein (TIGR00661 family)
VADCFFWLNDPAEIEESYRMKILYGVQATGNGHICRSREVIAELKLRGHDVQVILSGRDSDLIRELQVFEPFTTRRGLTFITEKGKLKFCRTAVQLNFPQFYRDIASFNPSGFDLVVTDFEPISARIARRHGIPSIGISHQCAFSYDIPMVKGNPLGRFILKKFAPADYMLGLHWHHFDQPILPPIVPDHFEKDLSVKENMILVYLPFEDIGEIGFLLRDIKSHEFHVYHGSCKQLLDEDNLHYRPFSRSGFLRDLCECNGVICNAGFELPSEALHLGKRVLTRPLAGQIEQESNAIAMTQLGLGTVSRKLSTNVVRDWLNAVPRSHVKPMNYPNVAALIAEWIGNGCWNKVDELVRLVWQGKLETGVTGNI